MTAGEFDNLSEVGKSLNFFDFPCEKEIRVWLLLFYKITEIHYRGLKNGKN